MNYLLIPAFSWLAAQGLKYLGELFGSSKKKQSSLMPSPLVLSGGMPSAHSATVTSLTVAVGYYEGIYSAIFAISLLFSSVVMYDAMMVRYSSGRQGEALNELLKQSKKKFKPVRIAHGHTPLEVLAGAVLGAIIACVVIFATK